MSKEFTAFENIKNENQKFHYRKSPISIYDVDINKAILSSKAPFSKKRS